MAQNAAAPDEPLNNGDSRPQSLATNRQNPYLAAMALDVDIIDPEDDEDSEVIPELRLDRPTIEWLARLHRVTGHHPRILIPSLLRAFRLEDEMSRHPQ